MDIRKLILYWIPPLIVMGTIFHLSSQQSIGVSEVYTVNVVLFKSLHIIEYAVLYFLLFRAYYGTFTHKNINQIYTYAIVTALLYAISDEVHQTLVPTRNGAVRDIFIDTIGILLCFQYTKINLSKLKRFL